ncbi:MAG TPA: 50S ribosomal protein L32e [Thermoplasmata archaeon]|nr:50S ribosomal protein L32e [Thermoplasmata archaeon]
MADEKEPKAEKKAKKAVPEAPEAPPVTLPTPHEIREAKKAELVSMSEKFGLETEGKVDDLRKRLLAYVEKREAKAAAPKEPPAAPEEKPAKPEKAEKKPRGEAKRKEKKPAKRAKKKEAKEEEEQEKAKEPHEPRQKPKLSPDLRRLLALRASKAAQRPKFRRQEWFRYKRFGDEWRKPQGGQSKLRRHFGYRWNLPSIGYLGPREVRGFHPSGFQEVLIHNPRELEGLDPDRQAVRIAHAVGARKRGLIERACDDKGLRVLNRMVTE